MIKKEVNYFEVNVKFLVREGSHEAETKTELKKNILGGIGKNEMNCIEAEDIKIEIK